MKILKEDFAEEQNKSVQKQTDLLNTIKNDPKGVQYVINFIRNELDEDDANDVEVVFKSQNTFDSYSRLLDTIVRDKVIEACEQFINNSTLTESENDEEISVKDALKEIIAKFGNHKYKYKLVAEEYQRYSTGGVYTKTFFAPNDYIALFSMTLHEAPTIANFEDYMDGDELKEYLDEYPTYESLLENASAIWWGDGDDFIISLENLTTGETLYEGGYNGYDEDDDDEYDWDEDLEESVNPLKDAQDEAKKHQKGKGPFVKLDAGDVEHNTQAFNNAMGSNCEGGACVESLTDDQKMPSVADVIDFLADHTQAFRDFKRRFKPKQNMYSEIIEDGLDQEEVFAWLQDHTQLYSDFKQWMDANNINESIEDIEKEEKKIEPQTINIRQALNELDRISENSDFINMYEAANLSLEDKQKLALMLAGQADANEIYDFLASKVGDGYLHSESHVTGDN